MKKISRRELFRAGGGVVASAGLLTGMSAAEARAPSTADVSEREPGGSPKLRYVTQAQYDALIPDDSTAYIIHHRRLTQ